MNSGKEAVNMTDLLKDIQSTSQSQNMMNIFSYRKPVTYKEYDFILCSISNFLIIQYDFKDSSVYFFK